MSFFAELKRRNVFKVAAAYVIVGWLIMQGGEVMAPALNLPDWVNSMLVFFLILGFPLAMVFAWAFEMTPEGIKKEKDIDRSQSITQVTSRKLDFTIIGLMALALMYFIWESRFQEQGSGSISPQSGQSSSQVATGKLNLTPSPALVATPANPGPSIAVLPFVNMSGDKENEYFSDGLTETLLHMLSQLPGLRVAARTSSFAFKGKDTGIAEIAATLGVAHILEGSVQKSGNRVRITAQLIRADDGFHVWSQNYTRPLEDIFAIQDEIAADVATALDASLLGNAIPDLKGVSTSNLTAYDSYLKGLEQQAIYSYGSLDIAEKHFKQALARDPGFSDARLALVRNYLLKNSTGVINEAELHTLADPLIMQVREQDPDNRLARAFELVMDLTNFNPERGAKEINSMVTELRNMLPLIAGETLVRAVVARTLNFFFKQEQDAIEVLEAGLLLDPLEAELHRNLGNIYRDNDRLEDALASLQRAQQLAPENPNPYGNLGDLERERNNLPAALNWLRLASEIDPQDHEWASGLARSFYDLQLPEEGDRWFARVRALAPGSAIARVVELDRAVARKEFDRAVSIAQSMIADQVEPRRGAFFGAMNTYVDLMMQSGRAREAYDFLVSVRPEITRYDILPDTTQGMQMQWMSIILMSSFESFDTRKQAWLKLAANLDARGFPWRDPKTGDLIYDLVITGDIEAAVEHFLADRLSKPMALNLQRHKRRFEPLFAQVYNDPRVAVRIAELDREFEQLRDDVAELMLEPEWSQ